MELCEVQVQPGGKGPQLSYNNYSDKTWLQNLILVLLYFVKQKVCLHLGFCSEPKAIDNAVRSVPDSQYKVGTTITYTCNKCYTGGGTSTCGCSREWSVVPQCSGE